MNTMEFVITCDNIKWKIYTSILSCKLYFCRGLLVAIVLVLRMTNKIHCENVTAFVLFEQLPIAL